MALNDAAGPLFPDAAPGTWLGEVAPAWLSEAHQLLTTGPDAGAPPVRGAVEDRRVEARPTRLEGGDVAWWLVDDTDRALAAEALATERGRTAFLAETSTALMSSLNVQRCMGATVELAARHLAEVAVLVAPAVGRRLPVASSRGGGEAAHRVVDADPASVTGLSEALHGFPPVPSRWIDPEEVPEWLVPAGFAGGVGSAVITPLPGHGVPAGALVLLRRTDRRVFTESEEVFVGLFAARAGAALSAARLYTEQAGITRTLMRELLPPRLGHVDGVEFAGGYRAAGNDELVGGDFYDLHPDAGGDGESLVVLGDVCGKGLEAAVLTGRIRDTLRALRSMSGDHIRVLELLNGVLLGSHHPRFATLVLASVSRAGRQVRLRLTSAGHPPPLIVRADGVVEEAPTRGTLVGALPEITATTFETELAPGETCLLYTDGVTEARGGPLGGDLFGEPRLATALAECAGLPAEAVVERVQMLATQWVGRRVHDDIALVAITAPRRAHLSAVDGHTRGRYTA